MKKIPILLLIFTVFISFLSFKMPVKTPPVTTIKGVWKVGNSVMICSDSYFSIAEFDVEKKKFDGTMGGTYSVNGNSMTVHIEYDYPSKALFNESETADFEVKDGKFYFYSSQGTRIYDKIGEAGTSPLSALWQITGREDKEGKMGEIKKAARKTIKLLTDNRFQWAAVNTETGEFFGTGGGTYILKDGKYTETIEFFSRDSSRVGVSLSFDAAIDSKKWQHSGKSSTGNKVNEIWEKQD